MSYKDKSLLKDRNGNAIPQYYDPSTDEFKPLTKNNGIDLPSDYPDNASKNELIALKDEVSELKTTINSLKEHTYDTQLTGRY